MSNTNTKPTGYICLEVKTEACDGIYIEKSTAEHMIIFMQSLWKGSYWTLIPAYKGDTIRGRFHKERPMQEELERLYGEPDYKSDDEYNRQF